MVALGISVKSSDALRMMAGYIGMMPGSSSCLGKSPQALSVLRLQGVTTCISFFLVSGFIAICYCYAFFAIILVLWVLLDVTVMG